MNIVSTQRFWDAVVLFIAMSLVALVTWFAPSFNAAATGMLFRLRGEQQTPDDVVIVAIDDASLQRVGKFPWSRSIVAKALDNITQANPKAVGLDVIYSEPSDANEDAKLAEAIKRNNKIILPAQLVEKNDEGISIVWLRPLHEFEKNARAIGHAHISPDVDGMMRSIQLSKADNTATRLWAFALEVVRVADGIGQNDFEEKDGALKVGDFQISVLDNETESENKNINIIRPNEMVINYVGAAGTFRSYSFVDILENKIQPENFTNKIVLIGATASSLGDTRVTPYIGNFSGREMPGVEIHANIINTIRKNIALKQFSEITNFLIALAVILFTVLAIKFFDGWRQILILGFLLVSIIALCLFAFGKLQTILPMTGMLTGFIAVIPLLLNQTLSESKKLDSKLEALAATQKGFLLDESKTLEERNAWLSLPKNLSWKLRAVDDITLRLLARMNFMDRVLTNMGDGVLVANAEGKIIFGNFEAASVFENENLIGENLKQKFLSRKIFDDKEFDETFDSIVRGNIFQKDFSVQSSEQKHFTLQMTGIFAEQETEKMIGIVALFTDITKRVELEQMRMETLQLVSHELRAPLTSIRGLSDVLLKFTVETNEAKEMLDTIHTESLRLSETVNRYLDLTRLESGRQSLRLSDVSIEQIVDSCVRVMLPLAAEKSIKIEKRIEDSLPALKADSQLLTQAINNLLSNAIKYSPHEKAVTIQIEKEDRNVLIKVRDEGHGIPKEEQAKIFEKFYRIERDVSSGAIGTGLGLPLVREIVEKHGGKILVESVVSEGTTFSICLPIK